MASNAPIIILDGATTPLSHTFDPAGISGNTARWQNRSEVMVTGRETLVLVLSSNGKTVRTITATSRLPYVVDETMNAVTNRKVASFATLETRILVPTVWTPTQAKMALGLHSNLLKHATLRAMVEDDEFVW